MCLVSVLGMPLQNLGSFVVLAPETPNQNEEEKEKKTMASSIADLMTNSLLHNSSAISLSHPMMLAGAYCSKHCSSIERVRLSLSPFNEKIERSLFNSYNARRYLNFMVDH